MTVVYMTINLYIKQKLNKCIETEGKGPYIKVRLCLKLDQDIVIQKQIIKGTNSHLLSPHELSKYNAIRQAIYRERSILILPDGTAVEGLNSDQYRSLDEMRIEIAYVVYTGLQRGSEHRAS